MRRLFHGLTHLLFPPKCVLCRAILRKDETDLCRICRVEGPHWDKGRENLPFLADHMAIWYYEADVRSSILRFKFGNARSYAGAYGRILAMKLQEEFPEGFDLLTWVPISSRRRWERGYDQVELFGQAVAKELGLSLTPTLKKQRNTPPQSGIADAAQRRANVLGAYVAVDPSALSGKRVLLLDDVITTGATASECARVLLTAGARDVICAAIAAKKHH